ncbi:hypothetical protein [Corynebacterium sp. 335C]
MSGNTGTQDAETQKPPLSRRVRVVQLIFLVAAVAATFALAYWQFSRWETTSSFQNLGYAFQWPAFGAFFIWAYRKYMQYEKERARGNMEAAVSSRDAMTEIPEGFLPDRPGSRAAGTTDDQDPVEDK